MKKDLIFKVAGLVISTTIGIIGLVLEAKKKISLSKADKEELATMIGDDVILKMDQRNEDLIKRLSN